MTRSNGPCRKHVRFWRVIVTRSVSEEMGPHSSLTLRVGVEDRSYWRLSKMIEELKEESIVNKVGGRFKLSTLIQKRLVQLNQGSRALVDLNTQDKMQVVLQEIAQDKIFLDSTQKVRIAGDFLQHHLHLVLGV